MAGEIAQVAAIAISTGMRVDELVRIPLAFPTYIGNLAYAAADASRQLELRDGWQESGIDGTLSGYLLDGRSATPHLIDGNLSANGRA
jgi:hypothetical protein